MSHSHKIIMLLCTLLAFSEAYAQTVKDISYQDLDGDGDPDLAVITTNFYTSSDKILVFDQDDDMVESRDYNICCDFDSDIWIFDSTEDGSAELIIDFERSAGKLVAYLYDDVSGDGGVSHWYNATSFEIMETRYPVLTVIAEDGFWEHKGKINFNIKMLGDGDINVGQVYRGGLENDGDTDFIITVYDLERDGDPNFELRERLIKGSKGLGMLMINNDSKETKWGNYIFWPFLGTGPGSWERYYNSAEPPILVDWKKAKISTIQLMVSDRFDDGNCFILTGWEIKRDEVNVLPFENPFCFYDLANDDDGIPEAIVRIVQPYPDTKFSLGAYYWNHNNDGHLDFGISSFGGYEKSYNLDNRYVSVVNFSDFSVVTTPFEDAPFWIFDQNWKSSFFVETNGLWGIGEGIYHIGNIDIPIRLDKGLPPFKVGFREEYSPDLNDKPEIYLSPIDRELHLKGAEEGIFALSAKKTGNFFGSDFSREDFITGNISTLKAIQYKNLDDDPYIDTWLYVENNLPVKQLYYSKDFLIYSEEGSISLKSVSFKDSLFESPPPRDAKELRQFKNTLENHGWELSDFRKKLIVNDNVVSVNLSEVRIVNFESIYKKFPGETIEMKGGILRDFNLTDKGFYFTFDCLPECKLDSFFQIKYKKPLTLGRYIFNFDGQFSIERMAEPDLKLEKISFTAEQTRELDYVIISATVSYSGTIGANDVVVGFYMGEPGEGTLISNLTIPFIKPSESVTVAQEWLAELGVEGIYVVVDPENLIHEMDEKNNIAVKRIYVSPLQQPSPGERIRIGSSEEVLRAVLLLVLGMLFLVFFIAREVFEH